MLQTTSSLHNERVLLRPFEPEDAEALRVYLNDPALIGRRYLPWGFSDNRPLSRKQISKILEKWESTDNQAHFAITLTETSALIGHAFVFWGWDPHCPTIGLVIAPEHQRQGYGSEALTVLVRWVFGTMPAHNISAWVADWNEPARELFLKYGFTESGKARRDGVRNGKFFDEVFYDILRPEWEAKWR